MHSQYLKEIGIKLTKHKLSILQLFDLHKHLDANQIYLLLNELGNEISIATIYRILSVFETNGILVKHNFKDDQSTYELASVQHHDHLICVKCHSVLEFYNEEIERMQEEIAKNSGFEIMNHSLNIYGICSACQK